MIYTISYYTYNLFQLKKIVERFSTLADVMTNVSFTRDISHFVKLQNSSKIPEPIRFSFQDPDVNLNPGEVSLLQKGFPCSSNSKLFSPKASI